MHKKKNVGFGISISKTYKQFIIFLIKNFHKTSFCIMLRKLHIYFDKSCFLVTLDKHKENAIKKIKYKTFKTIPEGIMSERPDTDADLMTERVFCLIIDEAGGIMIRPVAGG